MPPEFYLDECSTGRTIRRFLTGLSYVVHTPPELYGGREQSRGVKDDVWLPDVGKHGWGIIGTDAHIFENPREYQAYLAAKVSVFLLPGESLRSERVELVEYNLAAMCAEVTQHKASVWLLTMKGPEAYVAPASLSRRQRNRRGV